MAPARTWPPSPSPPRPPRSSPRSPSPPRNRGRRGTAHGRSPGRRRTPHP
nr:MAG TPA: hypothetical protein [Caudoviricetes sp.]